MRKAQRRLEAFLDHAKVLVLASHDSEVLRRFCNFGFVLKAGSLIGQGPIDEMIDLYTDSLAV